MVITNLEKKDSDTINNELFIKHLAQSIDSVWLCARYLGNSGYTVQVNRMVVGPHEDWKKNADDGDLYIWRGDEKPMRVEIKNPRVDFGEQGEGFPYESFIVCAAHSWKRANPKPTAYMLLNGKKTHFAIIKGDSHQYWFEKEHEDRRYVDKYTQIFYHCPLEYVQWGTLYE